MKIRSMNTKYYEAEPDAIGGEIASAPPPEVSTDDTPPETPPAEPANKSDWRADMAGGDEGLAKRLARYTSPADVGKAFNDAQNKIRAGAEAEPLAEDATDEQIAAYRDENGIPPEPKDYLENLPDGLVIGDDDMEVMGLFTDYLHQNNYKIEEAQQLIGFYNETKDAEMAAHAESDQLSSQEADERYRDEWGNDYTANKNLINTFIEKELGENAADFLNGRDANGLPIMNNPAVLGWTLSLARELSSVSTIVGGPGQTPDTMAARKDTIEGLMGDKTSAYWKGDKADKMQEEYRSILAAENRQKERNR